MRRSTGPTGHETVYAWLMSAPALIGLFIFVALPLFGGVYWSLTNKRLISPLPTEYIGLQNYWNLLGLQIIKLQPEIDEATGAAQVDLEGNPIYPRTRTIVRGNPAYSGFREWFTTDVFGGRYVVIARDPTFLRSLINTCVFVLVIVPGQGGLALIMALLVNQRLRGRYVFRTIYFSPVVTSMAVLAIVWTFLYNPDQGLINRFLSAITFGRFQPDWLVSADSALLAIIILSAWQAAGFQMVIFLAGLQGIPQSLYEAAQIDGGNTWQQFRHVTIPQLRNTTIFVIISTTILAFRLFTQVDVMTKGGPQDATVTVVFHAVDTGFRQQKIGYGSAVTVLFFIIVVTIALIQRALLKSDIEVE
ncbi:MAG: sugar ABC transporter permease [Chloroflexi bacterium]|nr:sugar ABC transporter permease [Chloroflexota bacterium]